MQTRRSWLKLGLASAAVIALGGGSLALLQPGLVDARLAPSARTVFAAVGSALLDGTLPAERPAREHALRGLLERIDALVAALPPHAQGELSQLLALLASAPGRRAVAGLGVAWSDAAVPELQQALDGMRLSSLALRQQAYHALHEITCGAYFAEPATWSALGYPGPVTV